MIQLTTPILATYGVLTMALACLWLPGGTLYGMLGRWPWLLPLAAAILLGLNYGFLQPVALLSIGAYGLVCKLWAMENHRSKWLSGSMVLALSVALFLHLLPGFTNPTIISGLRLSEDAVPYQKFLNFDSALIGFGILGFGHRRISGSAEWLSMLRRAAPVLLLTLVTVMLLSLQLGYVHWQPKWTPLFMIWAWGNLFFTCIAEEAFFRGLVQKQLMLGLSNTSGGTFIALSIASLLFGLAHIAGGINYAILATVAGIGYGWAYFRSQCIEAAIVAHFILNSLHFLLFTYPVLASALP